jgi:hypothetical protein
MGNLLLGLRAGQLRGRVAAGKRATNAADERVFKRRAAAAIISDKWFLIIMRGVPLGLSEAKCNHFLTLSPKHEIRTSKSETISKVQIGKIPNTETVKPATLFRISNFGFLFNCAVPRCSGKCLPQRRCAA